MVLSACSCSKSTLLVLYGQLVSGPKSGSSVLMDNCCNCHSLAEVALGEAPQVSSNIGSGGSGTDMTVQLI